MISLRVPYQQQQQQRFSGITADRFSYLGMAGGDAPQRPMTYRMIERPVSFWLDSDGKLSNGT